MHFVLELLKLVGSGAQELARCGARVLETRVPARIRTRVVVHRAAVDLPLVRQGAALPEGETSIGFEPR